MANGKKKIQIYADWWDSFKEMDNETAGKLIKLILGYVNDEHPERDLPKGDLLRILFIPYQKQLDAALEQWKSICERNSSNGSKGGRPKAKETEENPEKPSGLFENPKKADKIREDKIRKDNTSLHSVLSVCVRENGLNDTDLSEILNYLKSNGITDVKYPDGLVKAYITKKKDKLNNPDWLIDYKNNIQQGVEDL